MKEFAIATDNSKLDPLEKQLDNLRWRLKLQLDNVARTESEIEVIEELLRNKNEL